MAAMSFVSRNDGEVSPWPKETLRGRVEEVDPNLWNVFGNSQKKFAIVTSETICDNFTFGDTESLCVASQVDYKLLEKHDNCIVEITGFRVRRGADCWFLVDSVRAVK